MNCNTHFSSVSPLRITAVCVCIGAAWVFAPHIAHAAVAFGEIGQNVAENAKGVAKGITMGGYAAGAGMGLSLCDLHHLGKAALWHGQLFPGAN